MTTTCAREDCNNESRQYGYCPAHAALVRRHGIPYRRKEQAEMAAGNAHEREMDALLAASPPVIEWERRGAILVAKTVADPHAETRNWSRPKQTGTAA